MPRCGATAAILSSSRTPNAQFLRSRRRKSRIGNPNLALVLRGRFSLLLRCPSLLHHFRDALAPCRTDSATVGFLGGAGNFLSFSRSPTLLHRKADTTTGICGHVTTGLASPGLGCRRCVGGTFESIDCLLKAIPLVSKFGENCLYIHGSEL